MTWGDRICNVCGKPTHKGGCKGFRRGGKRVVDPEIRFWRKVDRKGDDQCWRWLGQLNNNGYGKFSIASNHVYAHRFSYMANVGPIADGTHVLHRCDNPPCVNPKHLFLGTQADNIMDMHTKGRHPRSPTAPKPTTCAACGYVAAQVVCSMCGTERAAYAALKNITAKQRAQARCQYSPEPCDCAGRGMCVEAV